MIESLFTNAMIPLTARQPISAQMGAPSSVSNRTLTTLGTKARNVHEIGILAENRNNIAKVTTLAVNAISVAIAQPIMPYFGMRMKFAPTFTTDDAIAATSEM